MKLHHKVMKELTVRPGEPAALDARSTRETRAHWRDHTAESSPHDLADTDLASFKSELGAAQELLYASDTSAVLVILQAPDAAGKDGTIKHVMSGINPQGCDVVSFKKPSAEELNHDFLWRCARVLPARGRIGIFNRSYYEEVLVTRVHPAVLAHQRLPPTAPAGDELWAQRYEDINAFERHLLRSGTHIVKLYLHVSEEEQKKRLLARLDDPAKYWKFSAADLTERAYFEDYRHAYEAAITATSTPWAPWHVIPADHKHVARALVAGILAHTIEQLHLHHPAVGDQACAELDVARRALQAS